MKNIFAFILVASSSQAYAGCELTAAGEKKYSSISISGCSGDQFSMCVEFQRNGGVKKREKLTARNCTGSICYSNSPSFTYVWRSDAGGFASYYLGERGGALVLICN